MSEPYQSRLCTDIGYQSLNKYGEELCGDNIHVITLADGSVIVVLADGLGSGVKACILSTLTSKIISTMMANDMSLDDCVSAIMATLPVCSVRQIAYSTFTILYIKKNLQAAIIQYDNPHVILLRGGKCWEFPKIATTIEGKTIYQSELSLQENDTFIAISDGVEHAGVGHLLNFGWKRSDIISFMEGLYRDKYAAKTLTTFLLDQCLLLYENKPGDDATVCTVKVRRRQVVNLLIGPPQNPSDDQKMLSLFFHKAGKYIICGGTTASLAAAYLQQPLVTNLQGYIDPTIPPTASIQGVDVVTEGVITLSRVLDYAQDYLQENRQYGVWSKQEDGASLIARLLFETATDINFFVGRAVNAAHQNPDLPIGFSVKMELVENLSTLLKQMGKQIKISYF